MNAQPRLCVGQVKHKRLRPVVNAFIYPVFYVLLPLRSLATAECGIFSVGKRKLLSFQDKDHGARDGSPLLPWIESLLIGHDLVCDGEIVLQTFPRVLGCLFNPVSFWYCHDRAGHLIAVLAEVNNTFGGTHSYLLHRGGEPLADGEELRAEKRFHVSPFNRIEGGYRFRFHLESAVLSAHIDYDDGEGELLRTSISGTPQPWSESALLRAFLSMPLLALGVLARIHWQALKLWVKGVPFLGACPDHQPQQKSPK